MATITTEVPTQSHIGKALVAVLAGLLVIGVAVGLFVLLSGDDTSPASGATGDAASTQTLSPAEEIRMFTDASTPTAPELSVVGEATAITGVR